jgi:hypothetical protein
MSKIRPIFIAFLKLLFMYTLPCQEIEKKNTRTKPTKRLSNFQNNVLKNVLQHL